LDGSKTAEIVLPYVAELGVKLGSEITLTSVTEAHATDLDHLYHSYLERVKKEVQDQVKEYGREGARIFSKILLGKPANEILSYAEETNAGLIVMASRGSSGEGPWLLGNIAAKVLRATSRPVLLIRAPASETALKDKRLVKKILVPLDGSKVGEAAIPCTEFISQGLQAELVLFHVVQPVKAITTYGEGYISSSVASSVAQDEESARASAITYLHGVEKPLKAKGLLTSSMAVVGSAAVQIIDYAKAYDIDLIAMSTHGRTGIGRWVFGSVTDKVLHAADTPILVIRASKT
jgi:nucleotide-binding universal stress UspA family protein